MSIDERPIQKALYPIIEKLEEYWLEESTVGEWKYTMGGTTLGAKITIVADFNGQVEWYNVGATIPYGATVLEVDTKRQRVKVRLV